MTSGKLATMRELPQSIESDDNVRQLVEWCVDKIGLGYHPDSRAGDYIAADGDPLFDTDVQLLLDTLHESAVDRGELVYDYGLRRFHQLLEPDTPNSPV